MMRTLLFRLVLLITLALPVVGFPAVAQERLPDNLGEFYSYGDNYFLEIATMGSTSPAKGRALVTFRLSYDLLNFRKATQAYQKGSLYTATPTIYMEAVGADGVIGDRASWRDTVRAQDYKQTNSKEDFVCGAVELALRPGLYTLKYSFDDGTPGSGFTQSTQPFTMDNFHSPSPAIGIPIFLRKVSGDSLVPTAIDGAAAFGRRLRAYIPLASQAPPKSLRYELLTSPRKPGETPKVLQTGIGTILGPATLGPAVPNGGNFSIMVQRDSTVKDSYGALIDLSTDDMGLGDYILTFTYEAGFNSVTDSMRFKLRWVDMPFSLARVDYAIKSLYPVASEDVVDDMLSGDRDEQREALNRFWDKRDPTPSTKFNEAMFEYYRRVDYSFFNFRGVGQNDGTFTDRAKIYILNGPPTEVNREMQPDSDPREVWVYRNQVNRRFIFVDKGRSGEYRLVEYNDL